MHKEKDMFKLKSSIAVGCLICDGLKDGLYRYRFNPEFKSKLNEVKQAGFDAVTIDICGMAYAPLFEEYSVRACKMVKKAGLDIETIHLPFGSTWVDLCSPWEADREEIIKWVVKVCKRLEKFGVRAFVMHPGYPNCDEETRGKWMDKLADSSERIAQQLNSFFCVENMVGGALLNTADKHKEFVDKAPSAYAVVDVNHLLLDKPEDALIKLGNRIKAVHISDYDFVYERHMLPGEGQIDWMKVIGALEQIGFDGAFNLELRMGLGYTFKQAKERVDELFDKYNSLKG